MSAPDLTISLTEDEAALVARIEFDQGKMTEHEGWLRNSELVSQLFHSLIDHEAIPPHRWSWIDDPECFVGGRGKSRKDVFERNGSRDEEMVRHNNFLKHVRYFVFGPNLPRQTIETFAAEVEACDNVTSGDIVPLGTLARKLTREAGLVPSEAAEKFMQLALELDMSISQATSIRALVMRA